MNRTLAPGDSGADVALFQRDLNVFYRVWGAPARVMLAVDGDYGPQTARAWRRVRLRLGLQAPDGRGAAATPRNRIVARHLGRYLLARRASEPYEIPQAARRTEEEIRRGREAVPYIRRLRARFKRMREAEVARKAHLTRNVRNQSSRNGVKPRIMVLHTTESHNRPGVGDLQGLASWFDNPAAQASSHIGNDAEGNDIRMVPDDAKAWTQAAYNSIALSIEQIGHASQSSWPRAQLENTARWLAHWSRKYDIPLVRSTARGVCQHKDLGAAGGGHHDCGPNYPLADVLRMARAFAQEGA
jgi:N-acetylmuramoyl-L-alanine amidase-like protein